jgi:hypothetical protein
MWKLAVTRCANCLQLVARDHLAQLGLAHQDQLQKLILVGVDVGEHPQLFEPLDRQVLRLVDDQHHMWFWLYCAMTQSCSTWNLVT